MDIMAMVHIVPHVVLVVRIVPQNKLVIHALKDFFSRMDSVFLV